MSRASAARRLPCDALVAARRMTGIAAIAVRDELAAVYRCRRRDTFNARRLTVPIIEAVSQRAANFLTTTDLPVRVKTP
ncbi:hypothetical protein HKX42_03385 [Salinisphaera sp. USBA-960]|nr:hypothetical protein [Salifodinibacter halophilus]